MNALLESVLDVAREHMGPAAGAFVTAELRAIGLRREELDAGGLRRIAARARGGSSRFMDEEGSEAFAAALDALANGGGARPRVGDAVVDHQLALNAAASLLARGDHQRAFLAYRDLAKRYHEPLSLHGLGRAAAIVGETAVATEALREAAVMLVEDDERDRAIALLEEAVALAPTDLASHRRLAALYANTGDVASARCEHTRFVEACLTAGDAARALAEIEYARRTVGDAPALRGIARRIEAFSDRVPAPVPVAPLRLTVVSAGPESETLTEARDLLAARKLLAATDLLLAYVASGRPGRDVQRQLITVARDLGRSDLASEKCRLLSQLLTLDGDRTGALQVERLALAS